MRPHGQKSWFPSNARQSRDGCTVSQYFVCATVSERVLFTCGFARASTANLENILRMRCSVRQSLTVKYSCCTLQVDYHHSCMLVPYLKYAVLFKASHKLCYTAVISATIRLLVTSSTKSTTVRHLRTTFQHLLDHVPTNWMVEVLVLLECLTSQRRIDL
jgi:hypothetical protein